MAERKIRFYELVNVNKERLPAKLPFDGIRSHVRDLPDHEAYVSLARLELLGSAYDPPDAAGAKPAVPLLTLDRITRDVSLRIEHRRNYRPLVLGEGETLAEPTFYSIFDDNVLGVMRNNENAPGPASFRDYVNHLGVLTEDVAIAPLADRNMLRALSEVRTLTKLDIAVGPDVTADVFGGAETIAGAIRHFRENLGTVGIEVVINIAPKGQAHVSEAAFQEVQHVVSSPAMAHIDKARIAYRRLEDGRADTYDFLSQAVATEVTVDVDDATEQPTEASAAQAMATAYDRLYEDIRSALKSTS